MTILTELNYQALSLCGCIGRGVRHNCVGKVEESQRRQPEDQAEEELPGPGEGESRRRTKERERKRNRDIQWEDFPRIMRNKERERERGLAQWYKDRFDKLMM